LTIVTALDENFNKNIRDKEEKHSWILHGLDMETGEQKEIFTSRRNPPGRDFHVFL